MAVVGHRCRKVVIRVRSVGNFTPTDDLRGSFESSGTALMALLGIVVSCFQTQRSALPLSPVFITHG